MSPLFFVCCPRIGGMIAGESLLKNPFIYVLGFTEEPLHRLAAVPLPFQGRLIQAPLKRVIPHGMGKCHEVTKGTAR